MFIWLDSEGCYTLFDIEIEIVELIAVDEIDYDKILLEETASGKRMLQEVKQERQQPKYMCVGPIELCGPDYLEPGDELDDDFTEGDETVTVDPNDIISVDSSKDVIIDGSLLNKNTDAIFKVIATSRGGLYAEQTFNCSFRNPKNPPPYFETEPPKRIHFGLYIDEIGTF
mmetsp:Transcript_2698/g.4216  ORF Transcript_2698/g.4216 Transcript_2698/m.4216 type:complete len:171 (+) Transcript_2698:689-1201(+)